MKKGRLFFLFLSSLALACGFGIYFFTRDWNIAVMQWLNIQAYNPLVSKMFPVPSFVRYQLAGGLWLLSGLLFLRALWQDNRRVFALYRALFCLAALVLELLQLNGVIPGTFDVFDLAVMAVFCLAEHFVYTHFLGESTLCKEHS